MTLMVEVEKKVILICLLHLDARTDVVNVTTTIGKLTEEVD